MEETRLGIIIVISHINRFRVILNIPFLANTCHKLPCCILYMVSLHQSSNMLRIMHRVLHKTRNILINTIIFSDNNYINLKYVITQVVVSYMNLSFGQRKFVWLKDQPKSFLSEYRTRIKFFLISGTRNISFCNFFLWSELQHYLTLTLNLLPSIISHEEFFFSCCSFS